jgi:hypothetical protein
VVLLSFIAGSPPTVDAAHYPASGDDSVCSACHTLDATEGDANTSYISSSARTFPQIKANDGLPSTSTPQYLGCTFCHYLNDNPAMKPVLGHFQGRLSFHPVGYNFSTHAETLNEYVTSYLSSTANQLDCVDCHDIDLGKPVAATTGYPDHSNRPVSNPYMLRNVTVASEYDGLCRGCHRSDTTLTVKGVSMQLTKHADGAAGRPLVEDDGTVLRTSDLNGDGVADAAGIVDQCRTCHDTHYSTKYKLFNDGHEKHKAGGSEVADTPIVGDGNNCTTVCHYPGDNNNAASGGNFGTYGHGKSQSTYKYKNFVPDSTGNYVTMGMNCTSCHVSLDIATKAHVEPVPSGANDQEKYKNRFNLNIPLQSGDNGSVYGNPIWGVCTQCHSGYDRHVGAGVNVGCQDCHDEHAEGSGATSNVFMIPQKSKADGAYLSFGAGAHTRTRSGTESVTYDSPRYLLASTPYAADNGNTDFYRNDAHGVCDNAECHGNAPWWPGPGGLVGIMGAGGSHPGGQQGPGTDCESCHRHSGDPGGGWRATKACDDCHAANGAGHAAAQGKNATTHTTRHRSGPYIGFCSDCHGDNGPGSPEHNNGTVTFGGAFMNTAFNYVKGTAFNDANCATAANGCHSAEPGEWAANSLGANACVNCHLAAGKALGRTPTSGLHAVANITRHDATLQSGNCVNCHDAAGPSSAHLNGTLNAPATATFAFNANVVSYAAAAGCQAAATCHGGGDGGTWRRRWIGVVDAVPGTAGNDTPGQGVCQNCHGDFAGWRWDGADAATTSHTDPYAGNSGDQMGQHTACQTCHGWGDAGYDTTWKAGKHGNGSIDLNGPDATHGTAAGTQYNDATGGCMLACHAATFVMNTGSGWPAAYGNYGSGDCSNCHKPGGSGPTVVWPAGNAVGRRTGYGSHLGATAAEEANGFLGGVVTWAGQCNKCHNFHGGTIKVPAPPASWTDPSGRLSGTNMRTRLGLPYALEANVSVHLGGTAQGGASEAEFCWGCHDANGVSEWGYNTKTSPAGFPVATFATADGNLASENNGWIFTTAGHTAKTSDWTQGYWQSPYDAALARRIASIHSASFDPAGQSSSVAANVDGAGIVNRTAPTLEPKGYLRCSNCHDVHDTFGPDGKPYLRGRSVDNPYPPELPPRSGYAYTTFINTLTGTRTPRALNSARDKGGYFIDQNSGWPTNNAAIDTLQETAELCTLCHGTDVDGMDFYTGRKLWRAPMVNGHSNAALGGTGVNKVDLFSGMRGDSYGRGMGMQSGQPSTPWACGSDGFSCDYAYPQINNCCVCEFDCGNIQYSGWYGSDFANWYGTGTIGSASGVAGDRAHKFTCSKCHTPHAAGLPALLTQSCIDPSLGSWSINGFSGANLIANNCHRKTSTTDGWHVLAPGQ